jgi:methylglyoxal synthase
MQRLFYFKTEIMSEHINKKKRIALVAHDKKKADLIDWAYYNRNLLSEHQLVATGTTGNLLEKKLNTPVQKLLSGPLGGDQQIGAMIAEGKLDIIIFFWDPMESHAHDSDVKAMIRLAVTWNIIIACNRTTADFILTSPLMQQDYRIAVPDFSGYTNRTISD